MIKWIATISAVHFCLLWTFICTFFFFAITGFSVYTLAALLAGIFLSFFILLEDEVIHQKIE